MKTFKWILFLAFAILFMGCTAEMAVRDAYYNDYVSLQYYYWYGYMHPYSYYSFYNNPFFFYQPMIYHWSTRPHYWYYMDREWKHKKKHRGQVRHFGNKRRGTQSSIRIHPRLTDRRQLRVDPVRNFRPQTRHEVRREIKREPRQQFRTAPRQQPAPRKQARKR